MYFEYYSHPLRIVSHRGSSFTSREFRDFMKQQNIQHHEIATTSPRSNGPVETINRTILPMIAKLTDGRNTRWSNLLTTAEFTINNVISKATSECPSMLLFGVRQRGAVIHDLRDSLDSRANQCAP